MRARTLQARALAAAFLKGSGRTADAAIVADGGGDDFAEVRLALQAIGMAADRVDLLERALRCYADPGFWEAEHCEASLAVHDRGEIARSALLGREAYALHRD